MPLDIHSAQLLVLAAIRRVFTAHAVVLFMPAESENVALCAADCADGTLRNGITIEPGKGLVGWILRHRQTLIVNNFDQYPSLIGYYSSSHEESRITAFMGCPLPNGSILCVDSTQETAFDNNHLETLLALGKLLNIQVSVDTTEEEDLRRYFTRLELIQELRVQTPRWSRYLPEFLKLVAEATGFDHVAFATRPDNGDDYVIEAEHAPLLLDNGKPLSLPLSGSVTGWVFRNEVPVHTEGLDGSTVAPLYGKIKGCPDFQAVVCIPIMINHMTTAVLCLGNITPRTIPQPLRSFIRMAVDELVQFLGAIYLRHKVHTLMAEATIHREGAVTYNPDTAPQPIQEEK